MTPAEKITNRVVGLLNKAESTSDAEAEALLAKATELMVKHEIDQAMLAAAGREIADEIVEHRQSFKSNFADAQRDLFFGVGRAFGFKLLQSNRGPHRVGTWIGWRSDIERAEVIMASLLIQQASGLKRFLKTDEYPRHETARNRWLHRRSWMHGFADGAATVLSRTRQRTIREADAERSVVAADENGTVALVLVDRAKRVTDWYDEKYGHLKAGRATSRLTMRDGYGAGSSAGARADVGSRRIGASRAIGSGS